MSDQDTLKSLQTIVCVKPYVYCEVGSYLGESLVPHLLDPMCKRVISIDPRPNSTPDGRGLHFEYNASTRDMRKVLEAIVPRVAIGKLETFEGTLQNYKFDVCPELVFIDAEHTNEAVFQDAITALDNLGTDGIIAFHDSNFVFDGLLNFATLVKFVGLGYTGFLPDNVFVTAFGTSEGPVSALPAHDPAVYVPAVRAQLHRTITDSV